MRNATAFPKPHRRPHAARTTEELLAERDGWLADIDPNEHFHRVLDLLPGVNFFAKNRRGETMLVSRSILARYGMTDDIEMLGLTDFDLNPENMAEGYVSDDERIYRTGEPILHRIELWFDEQGVPDWYLVHKLPIRSRSGEIIGIMGILQSYSGREKLIQPFFEVVTLVDYIRKHSHEPIAVEELAEMAAVSVRQLERNFKAAFGMGPQEFIIKTRILEACHALRESGATLAEIAMDHGFCDQSSFTQHFKKHIGQTPAQFRRSSLRLRERTRPRTAAKAQARRGRRR
jgi:AraC-like DNA-binding protein